MKKICLEEHWGSKKMEELRSQWLKRIGFQVTLDSGLRDGLLKRMWAFEERLPVMDEHDITMQVLSLSSPGVQGIDEPKSAVSNAKYLNDVQAELINRYPSRFLGFAALPLQDPKAAADELERSVKELGFKGAMIHGHTNGEYLDEQKFWILWERAEALKVPLYLHVNEPLVDQLKIYEGYREMLGPTWNWGVETATHALRIVFSGVFDRFPKATLILGHMGESLPYVLGRLDEGFTLVGGKKLGKITKMPSQYIKENIMITTSGKFLSESMTCAVQALGIDRILFATDYPFASTTEAVNIVENSFLSIDDKEKIYYQNAAKLFDL